MGYSPRGRKELDTTEQLTQILISSFDHHNSAIILRDFFFCFFFLNQILSSRNSTTGGRSEWGDGSSLSSSRESGSWESRPESRQQRFQLLYLLFLPMCLSFCLCFLPPHTLEGSQPSSGAGGG